MKLIKRVFLSIFLFNTVFVSSAQDGWNWGVDPDKAKEQNKLYNELYKAGNYADAIAPLGWLLKNTPDLNVAIYINGIKVYTKLAQTETDPTKKYQYQKSALELHDSRIKHFNDEAKVLDRKAHTAYKFYSKDEGKYRYLYELYSEVFDGHGDEMMGSNLIQYLNVMRKYNLASKTISNDQYFDTGTKVIRILNKQKENALASRKVRYDKMLDLAWTFLESTVDFNCDLIRDLDLERQISGSKDVFLAKKLFSLALQEKCTDRYYFLEIGEMVFSNHQEYNIAYLLGHKNLDFLKYEKANQYFNHAIELANDDRERSKALVGIGLVRYSKGKFLEAKEAADKALALNPQSAGPYTLLGHLYFSSYEKCKEGKSKVTDRAVYIAAYNMYEKAADISNVYEKPGNLESAIKALNEFPLKEDIIGEGYREGQSLHIECWIDTEVTILSRPAD